MRYLLLLIVGIISACDSGTKIDIRSTPEGATVTESVKGTLGETPTRTTFNRNYFTDTTDCPAKIDESQRPCRASFYFTKPGYEPMRVERLIKGDQMAVHAYLEAIETSLFVSGFPGFATVEAKYKKLDGSWRTLSLSGKVGNMLSLNDEPIWEGKDYLAVTLYINSQGYYTPEPKRMTLHKGDQKRYEYVLEEYAFTGTIESSPTGADVYEKSLGYLGRTPFTIRIPYDQLMRISPQRQLHLSEPIYLFLQVKKTGFQPTSEIAPVGEIDESKEPEPFDIFIKLPPIQKKH